MARVRVPSKTGEITIRTGKAGVEEVLKFEEKGGFVDVDDEHLELFLTHVAGSSEAPAAPAPKENK
jgi:hypothetical protein